MNRVYQGQVTCVEVLDGKDVSGQLKWKTLPDWQSRLWQHHQLFQDAVNYYTLALAAMIEGLKDPKVADCFIEQEIEIARAKSGFKDEGKSGKAIQQSREEAIAKVQGARRWREQVSENWFEVRRKAKQFVGPADRLARYLQVTAFKQTSFAEYGRAILKDSKATTGQRALAVLRLLELAEEASELSQLCVNKLPWLCNLYTSGQTDDAARSEKLREAQDFARAFRAADGPTRSEMRNGFDPGLFVQQLGPRLGGELAKNKLRQYFDRLADAYPEVALLKADFESWLSALPKDYGCRVAGKRYQKEYPAAVLFKEYGHEKAIADAFADVCKALAEKSDVELLKTDALKNSRTEADARHFDYFTNIAFTRTSRNANTQGGSGFSDEDEADKGLRAVWFEFDLAAFLEAIKGPHRYYQDTQAREATEARILQNLAAIEGQGRTGVADGQNDEEADLDGFDGDLRVQKIIRLVFVELAIPGAEEPPEYHVDLRQFITKALEAQKVKLPKGQSEYTIRERTLRGWKALREKWLTLAEGGRTTSDELWNVAAAEQTEHRFDAGSATLFKKLAEPEWQDIWLGKRTREWHAEDPLMAWMLYTKLRRGLRDKERPICFTPAHAEHSPRFFTFPKKSAGGGKWGTEHIPDVMAFTAGIAVRATDGERWATILGRFSYSAPRMWRDELRSKGETNLESTPWLQPMVKALGLPEKPEQDFGNCRIILQSQKRKRSKLQVEHNPDGDETRLDKDGQLFDYNHQLSFPIDLDAHRLIDQLGKKDRWDKQFGGRKEGDGKKRRFIPMFLLWPGEPRKIESKTRALWYASFDSFRCLAIKLGRSEAGAYALLDICANRDCSNKPSRFIGETPGKQWSAALAASGLLRLSGEDSYEWRQKSSKDLNESRAYEFREELYGKRGRMARDFESRECRDLLNALLGEDDAKEFMAPQTEAALSFPEQNDELLRAFKRAQWRVARLHRWCWLLGDEEKRESALTEIRESLKAAEATVEPWFSDNVKLLIESENGLCLKTELARILENRLTELPTLLVRLTNRVLPARGCLWTWKSHPEATKDNRTFLLAKGAAGLGSKDSSVWVHGQRGLSIRRIEQLEQLRRRIHALSQSLHRQIGTKPQTRCNETISEPCPELLAKLDRLREQRVNQTAHLILAQALGVRLAKPPADKAMLRHACDQHGVYEKIRDPVDFIVVEDFSPGRINQNRAPRENSRLTKLCHHAVIDKLHELCEPFGILVIETPAAYTSRFCSRTGVPGFRALEVKAGFHNETPWRWRKERRINGKLTAEAQFLRRMAAELNAAQKELDASWKPREGKERPPFRTFLLPQAVGPIFVPVVETKREGNLKSAVMNADVTAAINLALRAVSDPRLWEINPRLRTKRTQGEVKNQVGDSVGLKAMEKRKYGENGPEVEVRDPPQGSALKETRNPNYFRDFAGLAEQLSLLPVPTDPDDQISFTCVRMLTAQDKIEIAEHEDAENRVELLSAKAFWAAVDKLKLWRCEEINKARLAAWRLAKPDPERA